MITLDRILKSFGSRILFELDEAITFSDGNRYALTGPNGAGKSTLLKIIAGVEEATSGTVTKPRKLSMLRQNIEDYREMKVIDAVIMGNVRLWSAMKERDSLYEQEIDDKIGIRLGELEEIIAEENGYEAEADAEVLLGGIGISKELHQSLLAELPTDSQFKVLLCQALFGNPEALLLDEPTNHLDLESIGWLEQFLHNYSGTLIVISHDRHFLNAVATHVADIDYDTIIIYPGNYDDMVEAKMATRSRAEDEAKSKEKKIAKLREFVAKFRSGTRASQVQSRMREIDRLQPQEMKQSNIQRPYIRFISTDKQPGKIILKAEELRKAYDGKLVIEGISFEIIRGDKIGVIGNNGRGKTTLLKMLAGILSPDKGTVELGHQVLLSYFPQNHYDIVDKSEKITLFEWLRSRSKQAYDQDIRGALGKLLFSGADVNKNVGDLSGGETARLILAKMMLESHNFLILDEPNNHLDLESVNALSWGLGEYKETAIFASHDRSMVASVANKIIAFEQDKIVFFDGDLEDYLESKQKLQIAK